MKDNGWYNEGRPPLRVKVACLRNPPKRYRGDSRWYNEGWAPLWVGAAGQSVVQRRPANSASQGGRDRWWYNEGRPLLRVRVAGAFGGTSKAGITLQVVAARSWGSI